MTQNHFVLPFFAAVVAARHCYVSCRFGWDDSQHAVAVDSLLLLLLLILILPCQLLIVHVWFSSLMLLNLMRKCHP